MSRNSAGKRAQIVRLVDIERKTRIAQDLHMRAAALGFGDMLREAVRAEVRRKQTWW